MEIAREQRGSYDSSQLVFGLNTVAGTNFIGEAFYDSSTYVKRTGGISWSAHRNANLWITPKAFSAADATITFTKGSTPPTNPIILANAKTSRFLGSMGRFYIYDDAAQNVTTLAGFNSITPVYTLCPCTFNGEAGMWCVETSTFIGKTGGSGTLTVENES